MASFVDHSGVGFFVNDFQLLHALVNGVAIQHSIIGSIGVYV